MILTKYDNLRNALSFARRFPVARDRDTVKSRFRNSITTYGGGTIEVSRFYRDTVKSRFRNSITTYGGGTIEVSRFYSNPFKNFLTTEDITTNRYKESCNEVRVHSHTLRQRQSQCE